MNTTRNAQEQERDPSALDGPELLNHPSFASTLANGLAVLGCFSGGEAWLGNKEIAERLGLTKPTVSRLAFTLIALGYLRRNRKTAKYQLGPAVLSLGYPLLSQLTIRQVAAAEMLELARHAQGPVSVGTRDRLQLVYVETAHGLASSATKPDIGSTRPILRTAMGRALVYAHQGTDRALLERRLQHAFPAEWELCSGALRQAYAEIQEMGFCVVAGDWRPTLAAVAVPMKAQVSGMHLAFNITVPSYATDRARLVQDLGPRLVELVRNVEQKLGM